MISVKERLMYAIYLSALLMLSMGIYTYSLFIKDYCLMWFGFGSMVVSFILLSHNTIVLFRILDREIDFLESEIYGK